MNNKFAVGSLVIMCTPEHENNSSNVPNGAIGTVMEASKYSAEIGVDEIAVSFPKHISETTTGWWRVPMSWLKPLGGDDLLDEEDLADSPYKVLKPVEDLV